MHADQIAHNHEFNNTIKQRNALIGMKFTPTEEAKPNLWCHELNVEYQDWQFAGAELIRFCRTDPSLRRSWLHRQITNIQAILKALTADNLNYCHWCWN